MNFKVISISKVDSFYKVWVCRDVVETGFVNGRAVSETVSNEFAVFLPADKVEGATQKSFREALRASVAAVTRTPVANIPAVASAEIGKTITV